MPSTKGATSNVSPGCCKICSVMERDDLPNTSEKTSSSFKIRNGKTILSTVFLTGNHTGEFEPVSYKVSEFSDVSRVE